VVGVSGDPIEQYLARLRAQLRTPAARTVQILAEAEDHLRESASAAIAIGMSEREAQEAAISAFGSVRTVVRAHRRPVSAVAADVGMALWKLAAAYLLAVPVTGVLLLVFFYQVLQIHTVTPGPFPHSLIITNGPADVVGLVAGLSGSAIAGLGLLFGCQRMCRSLRRRGQAPRAPFGAFFPLAAAIFMLFAGPTAGALIGPHVHLPGGTALLAASGVAASVLVALSDVAVMAVMIVRQGRDARTTGQEARHAG
jgi:hypothetical protein